MPWSHFDYIEKIDGHIVNEYECRVDADFVDGGWYLGRMERDVRVNAIQVHVYGGDVDWVDLPADHRLFPLIEAAFLKTGDVAEAA